MSVAFWLKIFGRGRQPIVTRPRPSYRLRTILKEFRSEKMPDEVLFTQRALEILELIGTTEARAVLEQVVETFSPELAAEASSSLQRLEKKNPLP
jgi:hypothetical protein